MNSFTTTEFGPMCRELRQAARLKQREVAERVGIAVTTYGNLESNKHKTVRRERAEAIARSFGLGAEMRAQLLAAWEAQPVSEYSQRQRESWNKRNLTRGKARGFDRAMTALLELASLLVTSVPDAGALCACPEPDLFADPPESEPVPCELCNALQLLGLSGWTTLDQVVAVLAKIQEGMAAE